THDGYKDWTKDKDSTETFDLAADYYPVVFTLKDGSTTLKTGTIAEIKAFLEAKNGDYEANKNLAKLFGESGTGTYTLTWAWAIDGNDAADTYLGNVAAGIQSDASASTTIDFAIAITVEQID
ncbi:MAG: hypothetical protein J6L87_04370, partial [Clostridia bacterium]|nr:hypothetical protein [Clostridia bacterium]